MRTRAAEAVDVVLLEPPAGRVKRCGVGASVLLDNIQLETDQAPDFIELKARIGHVLARNSRCCWARPVLGNWFHSRPSSNRPPVFGERPPHCLKKKATFAATH